MSAGDTMEALLKLGVAVKGAFTKAQSNKTADWVGFLDSEEYNDIEADVRWLADKLTESDLDEALAAVRTKEAALLASVASVAQLPTDKLLQYSDLVHTESLLVNRKVSGVTPTAQALQWVVDDALPVLLSVAKIVVPLLL